MKCRFFRTKEVNLSLYYFGEGIPTLWDKPVLSKVIASKPLKSEKVNCVINDNHYSLKYPMSEIEELFIRHLMATEERDFEGDNVTARLTDITFSEEALDIYFQPSTYSQYLATGWASSQNYAVTIDDKEPVLIRDIIEPGPYLQPLNSAIPSNHLGINCLIISEGNLVMRMRSEKVMTDVNTLDLSASGALDYQSTEISPFDQAIKEIEEELGISSAIIDETGLTLIGIAREFERAGKPEAYIVAETKCDFSTLKYALELVQPSDMWETSEIISVNIRDETEMRRILEKYRLQPSARTGIWLLLDSIRTGNFHLNMAK